MESILRNLNQSNSPAELTLIIPCFNESNRLPSFLETFVEDIPQFLKIIIIDDGSSKDEYQLLKDQISIYLNESVELHHYEKNLGKFNAIEYGIQLSKSKYIGFVDADGSVPFYEVLNLWNRAQAFPQIDLFISSRENSQDKKISYSIFRYLTHKIFIICLKILFKIKVNDTQCGLKILKKSIYLEFKNNMINRRWIWDTEIIILADYYDKPYQEIYIDWKEMSGSKFRILRDSILMLIDLYEFKKHIRSL
jgi:glycosyltransferase involved in cell wall biosynthesis